MTSDLSASPARETIARLLRPASVAIVGASASPGALGYQLLANLERQGYAGTIHLINPRRAEIAGRACLASVADLPEGVDVAVLAIPRDAVLETVRALAARGVGGAIIFFEVATVLVLRAHYTIDVIAAIGFALAAHPLADRCAKPADHMIHRLAGHRDRQVDA